MTHSEQIKSLYKNGTMCYVYSLCEDGNVCAVDPPLVVADTDQAVLDAQIAKNTALHNAVVAAEAIEAAARIQKPDPTTPKTTKQVDENGVESDVAHPAWKAYDDAQAAVAAASTQTNNLISLRKGIPSATIKEGEEEVANPDYVANKAAWTALNTELN